MLKPFFITLVILSFFKIASAQKKADTVVYYLKNDGKVVKSKDSADLFLLILPPDTAVDKTLFRVSEYYPNGKMRLLGSSITNNLNLKFQGSKVTFFPNGHKLSITNYDNGIAVGDILEFYPSGKFYSKKSLTKNAKGETELLYEDCNDSTGVVLAENGNGKWLEFNDDFSKVTEGQVTNGNKSGNWIRKVSDSSISVTPFENGRERSTAYYYKSAKDNYAALRKVPSFPGGLEAFGAFISKTILYPKDARELKIQGKTIISFTVEKDGTLTDFKVMQSASESLDNESLRVMKLSPKWIPATVDNKPVQVEFSVPIAYTLSN